MSPSPPQPVPQATVAGAVAALTKWMKKRAAAAPPSLLADERDDLVILQLSLRRVPASPTTRPHPLPLPHPVVAHAGTSVCVISDDRPNSRSPPASDLLDASKSHSLPVSEVIPLSTLRTDYRPYESRRRLVASHDLFIADRAILPLLPRVLGKAFYSTKKAPIGVDFSRVGWPEQIRKVLRSTFLYLRSGTCCGIKVGRLDMAEEEIVANVMAVAEAAVEKVPKKWANVRAMHLKAVESVALPIYQAVPELGMKIEVPVVQLEGEGCAGEVIDAAELESRKKKMNKESGKRKWNKKEQAVDVVMHEEVQAETKKKRKTDIAVDVEEQKVDKKGKAKGKHPLENEVKQANKSHKGKKASKEDIEHESEDMTERNYKKGNKKDVKHESDGMSGRNNGKDKKQNMEEGKKEKNMKNFDGSEASVLEIQEKKKSKGKKLDEHKIEKTRTKARV